MIFQSGTYVCIEAQLITTLELKQVSVQARYVTVEW